MSMPRHFADICEIESGELRTILEDAKQRKAARAGRGQAELDDGAPLSGKLLAMIFIQPSTRTRVSFDVGMRQLGGETVVLNADDLQLDRGTARADTRLHALLSLSSHG